jgi:formylglycine-generating enzyme required for sulfatase activity
VQASDAGSYTVVITNAAGSVTSPAGTLALAATGSRLVNLSILTSCAMAGDTFTMGYVVGGGGTSGTKPLVIRAAGPSLGALGVPGTLDDPKLELFAGPVKTGENDNWGGSATLANAMAAVGAFAYMGPTSRDAVVALSVASGDNSVKVSAAGNGTGTVIAEIYDATPSASFTSNTPRLVNVSVLKQLGAGFTIGFYVDGVGTKNVLVRAIGPTLGSAFGLAGAVNDPQLTLYSGQTAIGSNDNWGGAAALKAVFASAGAFALPDGSRDAAAVVALQPGGYTVVVSGVGNTGGITLVEVYELAESVVLPPVVAPSSFALIPAGTFTMGDNIDGWADAPTHAVTLAAFYLAKTETTKAEWDDVRSWAASHGYTDLAPGDGKAANHPVQTVTWYDVVKWCNARSEKEGLAPVYYTNDAQTTVYRTGTVNVTNAQVKWLAAGYRLPTEAEWEYAARGGLAGKRFPWGDTISHQLANYDSTYNSNENTTAYDVSATRGLHPSYSTGGDPYTSPVASFAANGYGLHDMAGNVWERCWDWHGSVGSAAVTAPHGATSGSNRVYRGGSWGNTAYSARCAVRYARAPTYSSSSIGFRPARSSDP